MLDRFVEREISILDLAAMFAIDHSYDRVQSGFRAMARWGFGCYAFRCETGDALRLYALWIALIG
jgi:hypothetical protein